MRVGWARPGCQPDIELGADDQAFVFEGSKGQRWHQGSGFFGRNWQIGRMNFGRDASTFKYYTMCGLQEGFEPFAVNMNREVAMWFSKRLPTFVNVPKGHPHIEITRIDGNIDNPPLEIREELYEFHDKLLIHCGIPLEEEKEEEENISWAGKLCSLIYKIKGIPKTEKREATEEEEKYPTSLKELISQTMVRWAQEDQIQDPELVRIMFNLLRRQYDSIGESVEENACVLVKLLIRRPECFGPALRGEGGNGLLAAMQEAIKISENPALDLTSQGSKRKFLEEDEEEEEIVHMGNAIMSFYSALIDLLGRCAPELHLIQTGKGEAIRIRSILRSLVPTEDLVGIISIPLKLPTINKDGTITEPNMSATFCPDHKAPMVLFLDRVYDNCDDTGFGLGRVARQLHLGCPERRMTVAATCLPPSQLRKFDRSNAPKGERGGSFQAKAEKGEDPRVGNMGAHGGMIH
ncbi:ryanodine receptor 3-like [Crotalus adamanteus]|uniref:Ryanodine receptor 3-like n=1 Tax=Crotalus adamanteus TaxID=8729 RepID=A0AAW1C5N5_CROAD